MVDPAINPVTFAVNKPVAVPVPTNVVHPVPPKVGLVLVVDQTIPLAVIGEPPFKVMVNPKVAVVFTMFADVGVVNVGTANAGVVAVAVKLEVV